MTRQDGITQPELTRTGGQSRCNRTRWQLSQRYHFWGACRSLLRGVFPANDLDGGWAA